MPSYLTTHYGRPSFRPYPSTGLVWYLVVATFLVVVPVVVAVPLGIRAGLRGERLGWVAAASALGAAAASFWVFSNLRG